MGEDSFESFNKKDEEDKMDKNIIEIKVRLNKFWIERTIYLIIIFALLGLVFYNPISRYKCERGLSEIETQPIIVTQAVINEEENKSETINESETTEINETKEEEIETENPEESEEQEKEEKELSGNVILYIDDVDLDENKTKIESITIRIDNQKKIFTPLVWVYWYDKESPEAIKQWPNGGKIQYAGAIPIGVKTWKLDKELKAHYLRPDNPLKEFIKIELYDASDNTELDVKSKTIATD